VTGKGVHVTSTDKFDPYSELRPVPPTPDDEICRCADRPPIVLQDHLSLNPIACLKCNGEVQPERIGFPATIAKHLAYWRHLHAAIYALWLDSGDYEVWARTQLADPGGQLNVQGLEIVRELNKYDRTYYWWFQDESADDFTPLSRCPRCSAILVPAVVHSVCEACSIVVTTE
jgi:hypothetical protein